MPTPRKHGGAALQPINLVRPGFFGLNTQNEAALLGPEWATVLNNAVFDDAGRLAARKGWNPQTSTPAATTIKQFFEFYKSDGTSELLSVSDSDIYTGVGAPSSIEGTMTVTDAMMSVVNFNEKAIAFPGNGTVYSYTGTGSFAAVTPSGTPPTGKIALSAFGRLWAMDADGLTLKYSGLLNEGDWNGAGAGVIDMGLVWPNGQDQVVGLAAFNGDIVVFGRNTIVFWSDGRNSTLGIDPTQVYVADTITGTGLVSQHAWASVKGDVWFLSESGVQSLGRLIIEKSNPLDNVSQNVQDNLVRQSANTQARDEITMSYSPVEDQVILCFPGTRQQYYFDTKLPLEDKTYRATTWTSDLQTTYYARNRILYGSLTTATGEVFSFQGFDDNGTSYSFAYESGWLDFGQEVNQYNKIVKRLTSVTFVEAATNFEFNWSYDFGSKSFKRTVSAETSGNPSEYNVCEFGSNGLRIPSDPTSGNSEYAGGVGLQVLRAPGRSAGQYVKVGITVDTFGAQLALQNITLYAKVGRLV